MSDSLNAVLVLSYFPCLDFPALLACEGGDFGQMHTTKIDFVADTCNRYFKVFRWTKCPDHTCTCMFLTVI